MRTLKKIKIFLGLKWEETFGKMDIDMWILYLCMQSSIFFINIPFQEFDKEVPYFFALLVSFCLVLMVGCLTGLLLIGINKLLKWIRSNWDAAEQILKNKEK